MKRICTAALTLLLLSFSIPALSQGGFFATVAGTVTDTSGALIPGVTVKATAVDTGVVTDAVTNESGAYNFATLLPGKYTLSASLPGFQTKNLTDIQLSQNTTYRYNFQLAISGVNTQVEVSVSAETMLATSGASVGQVLSQQKVQDLPMVGNNVLDLITVMAGVENVVPTNPPSAANAFGRENTTFAGVSAQNVAIVRDGIQVQDNRYPNGIYSVTTINPDLVGEIRLILAPVDAEMGRGNGAIQYSTRSGTNKFAGSAVWSFRNTALDPNSWANNRNQTVPAGSPPGTIATATQPDWNNVHQGTVSFGGPIVKNKTFFFGLFDMNQVYQRTSTNFLVPTPCARLGIFRYFNGWNNAAGGDGSGGVFGSTITTGPTPQRAAVNLDGSPKPPTTLPNGLTTNPNGSAFDPSLQYISVYGPLQSNPTTPDCSDAAINKSTLVPNGVSVTANPGAGGGWDLYRKQLDQTGFISRTMDFYPGPNNYEIGDGLNFAGYRVLRHFNGLDNLFGSGEATGIRKQFNVKIDHNFSANHKANVNWTYERVHSDDVVAAIPGMFSNQNFRRPMVVSAGFTSTLSATMLNEARFGMRRQGTNVIAPWDRDIYNDDLAKYFPAPAAGFDVIPQITTNGLAGIAVGSPAFCYPHSGARPPGGCGGGALTATSIDKTPTYTFADTLSWTRGAHAFKFGGELRLNSSEARTSAANFFGNPTYAKAVGGSITGTGQGNGATDISGTTQVGTSIAPGLNTAMPFLMSNNATNAKSLSNYLSASLSNLTALYFLTDPNQLSAWSDFRNQQLLTTKLIQREFSAFVKDDYKLTKNLTLNLGLRWDYYGVPYVASGLTVAPVGGGDAAFGISGRNFTGWMVPGRRDDPTSFEFVGPGSPNSSKTVYPNDYNNFGPAVGFAWQVPWFGEGKTTVRGGYQVTFQGGGRFNTLQGPLAAPPGSTLDPATPNWTNVYRDLTNVPTELPITPSVLPMQPIPLDRRTQTFTAFDPNYVDPYVQNLTLSVSRSVSRNVVLDVRYVGTLSRKNYTTLNLNSQNFIANGLVDDLNRARAGTEVPGGLLDQMFAGINLCTSALLPATGTCTVSPTIQYGAIGSTTPDGRYQSAAFQMRNSSTFQGTLANGQYVSAPVGTTPLVTTIANFNYSLTGSNVGLPAIAPGTVGAALRKNGFDENFIFTNPQFSAMNYFNNSGYSNYHSLEVSASLRPIHGFSGQATYTWSKNLGLPTTLTDPTNRALDYTNINNTPGHSLRTNSTIELPIGPNKLFFGNSQGWVARAIERWQLGLLYNLSSGYPQTITAQNMLYGNGVPDVVAPVDFNNLKGVRWGIPNGSQLEGRYFDNNDTFVKVADPQCATLGAGLQNQCTLGALAMIVPAGSANSFVLADGRTAQIVLQNPQPGKRGTLGANSFIGLGTFRFDANLGKTFKITESKSLAVRFDAQNVLNHPQPAFSLNALTINGTTTPFGQLSTKTGARLFQGQLRLTF